MLLFLLEIMISFSTCLICTIKEENLYHVMEKNVEIAVSSNFWNMILRGKVDTVTFPIALCPNCSAG